MDGRLKSLTQPSPTVPLQPSPVGPMCQLGKRAPPFTPWQSSRFFRPSLPVYGRVRPRQNQGPAQHYRSGPVHHIDHRSGYRQSHGQFSGIGMPCIAQLDRDQGHKQGCLLQLPSLHHWSLQPCGRQFCQVFHCSTEVFAGNASLLVKALQLCSCFKWPEKHADSAAHETSACDRSAQTSA